MQKFILFFLIFASTVYGYTYKDVLIKAQVAVFPKILLLDKKLNEKLVDNKIVLIIAHEERDRKTAIAVKNLLSEHYKGFLSSYGFEIEIMEFSRITEDTDVTAIFALNSATYMCDLSKIAVAKGIVTFVYNIAHLKDGLMFSLVLEKNTVLYLNKKNLRKDTTDFIDALYELVKFPDLN